MIPVIIITISLLISAYPVLTLVKEIKADRNALEAYDGITEGILPELRDYGKYCKCRNIAKGEVNGICYTYYNYLRIADSEKDIGSSRQTFNADVIKLTGTIGLHDFALIGDYKNYCPKLPVSFTKAGGAWPNHIYAPYGELTDDIKTDIKSIQKWWKSEPSENDVYSLSYYLNSHFTAVSYNGTVWIICSEKIDDIVTSVSSKDCEQAISSGLNRIGEFF